MNPLSDDELTNILRKLEPSPAPTTLEARIFGSRTRQFESRQWRRTIFYSVRIPVPILGMMVLTFFTLGALAFRVHRSSSLSAGDTRISASEGGDASVTPVDHVALTEPHNPSISRTGEADKSKGAAARLDDQTLSVTRSAADRNLINSPEPNYPLDARNAGLQGIVKLRVRIGTDGRVTNATVISGNSVFAPAAIEAVKQRVYRPTLLNGNPIAVISQVDVAFRLNVTLTSSVMQ